MRVRLILSTIKPKSRKVLVKEYPFAVNEEEARSMMFRDNSSKILKVVINGGRVLYNVEKLDTL